MLSAAYRSHSQCQYHARPTLVSTALVHSTTCHTACRASPPAPRHTTPGENAPPAAAAPAAALLEPLPAALLHTLRVTCSVLLLYTRRTSPCHGGGPQ
jgi:hypothetical protein